MELKSEKFLGGACPQTSLETCAFDARLEHRSAVILDHRLYLISLPSFLILIGFKRRRHTQGRRFLSSHFTMCSSKFIILARWKSLK